MAQSKLTTLSSLTLIGVALGAILGFVIPEVMIGAGVIGELFLNALKIVLLPLIAASIIMGISRLGGLPRVGRTAINTITYFVATTLIAVVIGLVLVMVFRPGAGLVETTAPTGDLPPLVRHSLSHFLTALLPANLLENIAEGQLLGLIVFALFFGAVLSTMGRKGRSVTEFFHTVHDVTLRLVGFILVAAPIGLLFLVGSVVAENAGTVTSLAGNLLFFILVLLIGLLLHGAVILPLALKFFGRQSPFGYFGRTSTALTTALGTASSVATLPITYQNTVADNNVDQRASAFVLPLGSSINMNGTALFIVVAAMFVAQSTGMPLSIGQILMIAISAAIISFGAVGVPGAGLVGLMSVLTILDITTVTVGIALVAAIDWLSDRLRTVVNVWGDSVGAAVVADTFEFKTAGRKGKDRQPRESRDSRGGRPDRDRRQSRKDSRGQQQRDRRPDRRERRSGRSDRRDKDRSRGNDRRRGDSRRGNGRRGGQQTKREAPQQKQTKSQGASSPFDIKEKPGPVLDTPAGEPVEQPSESRPEQARPRRKAPSREQKPSRKPPRQSEQKSGNHGKEQMERGRQSDFRLDSPPPLPVTGNGEKKSDQEKKPEAKHAETKERGRSEQPAEQNAGPQKKKPSDTPEDKKSGVHVEATPPEPETGGESAAPAETEKTEESDAIEFGRRIRRSRVSVSASSEESDEEGKESDKETDRESESDKDSYRDVDVSYGRGKRKKPGR